MVSAPKLHIQEWAGGEVINIFHRWSQFVPISFKTLNTVLWRGRQCFRALANEVQECYPFNILNTV